jgi:hypothetical protein
LALASPQLGIKVISQVSLNEVLLQVGKRLLFVQENGDLG